MLRCHKFCIICGHLVHIDYDMLWISRTELLDFDLTLSLETPTAVQSLLTYYDVSLINIDDNSLKYIKVRITWV